MPAPIVAAPSSALPCDDSAESFNGYYDLTPPPGTPLLTRLLAADRERPLARSSPSHAGPVVALPERRAPSTDWHGRPLRSRTSHNRHQTLNFHSPYREAASTWGGWQTCSPGCCFSRAAQSGASAGQRAESDARPRRVAPPPTAQGREPSRGDSRPGVVRGGGRQPSAHDQITFGDGSARCGRSASTPRLSGCRRRPSRRSC